jgi:hypothetical protein
MGRQANVRLLYEANGFPIFQNQMYSSFEEAVARPTGDIRLVENLDTGLVYNDAFSQEQMHYDNRYQNEQGVSSLFQQHLRSASKVINDAMGKANLVEVGCGKGYFLEMLLEQEFDVTGFDPTYEGDNPRIRRRYFEPESGTRAEGIILRHVLEHIQNPVDFLTSLREENGGSGLIYIEVPCFDWICQNKVWFDIFYEHVNYFRLSDFFRIFGNVIRSGRAFGDQYLYIVADLASLRPPAIDNSGRIAFPSDFLARLEDTKVSEHEGVAIWGGSSKGVIFSLLKSRVGQPVEIVIDINPAKQGKYLAATGLRVCSPEEGLSKLPEGATIYVMNSNYLQEIQRMSNFAYRYVTVDHD